MMRNRLSKTFARWTQSRRTQMPGRGVPITARAREVCDPSDERGQAIVIIALALIGLVAFAGLVFDGGTAYAERRRMQNSSEAGALAGAYKLAYGGPTTSNIDVCHAIRQYAKYQNGQPRYAGQVTDFEAYYIDQNGNRVSGEQLNVQDCGNPGNPPSNAKGVVVTQTTTFNTFFMNVLGMPVGTVNATAKAIFGACKNCGDLSPIAPMCRNPLTGLLNPNPGSLADCGYQADGTIYNLWNNCTPTSTCPGNFGWLDWTNTYNGPSDCPPGGGQGVPQLCENVRHPEDMQYTHRCNPLPDSTVSIGDCIDGLPGVKNSTNIVDALKSLVDNQTQITVPIWGATSGSGSTLQYTIVNFATFVVTGFYLPQGSGAGGTSYFANRCFTNGLPNDGGGGGGCIVGYFVNGANVTGTGDLCMPPGCNSFDTGTRVVSLIGP